eukprot:3121742-Rhodomonas_salina.1
MERLPQQPRRTGYRRHAKLRSALHAVTRCVKGRRRRGERGRQEAKGQRWRAWWHLSEWSAVLAPDCFSTARRCLAPTLLARIHYVS